MDNISDIVWLIKAGQKQDKDLQKGKKPGSVSRPAPKSSCLTQEGAKDIAYTLCVYMDQKRKMAVRTLRQLANPQNDTDVPSALSYHQ